ncbi:MAG TPA: hypothetical protein VFP61_09335 [Acidimicrobiales bacterium]|nr:hypothetical protein [Acidimicrobiales bacterium]
MSGQGRGADGSAGAAVATGMSVAGIGVAMAAIGVLPALLGSSLHAAAVTLHVTHWVLAALMPFAVATTAALAVRTGRPGDLNGRPAAWRTMAIGVVGSLLSEAAFQLIGSYGAGPLTGRSVAVVRHATPNPFSGAQVATVVALGTLSAVLLASSQWRHRLRLRQPPAG